MLVLVARGQRIKAIHQSAPLCFSLPIKVLVRRIEANRAQMPHQFSITADRQLTNRDHLKSLTIMHKQTVRHPIRPEGNKLP